MCFCSPHNNKYYPLSPELSLTTPTIRPLFRLVCLIPAPFPRTLSLFYDPDAIAPLPTADCSGLPSMYNAGSFGSTFSKFIYTLLMLL